MKMMTVVILLHRVNRKRGNRQDQKKFDFSCDVKGVTQLRNYHPRGGQLCHHHHHHLHHHHHHNFNYHHHLHWHFFIIIMASIIVIIITIIASLSLMITLRGNTNVDHKLWFKNILLNDTISLMITRTHVKDIAEWPLLHDHPFHYRHYHHRYNHWSSWSSWLSWPWWSLSGRRHGRVVTIADLQETIDKPETVIIKLNAPTITTSAISPWEWRKWT